MTDYKQKIISLKDKYELTFQNDLFGGGEFIHKDHTQCHVNMIGNYKDDYKKLLRWLKEKKP